MPSNGGVPIYQGHSYAYWSNFYASPTDLLVSKALGGGAAKPATPKPATSNFDVAAVIKKNQGVYDSYAQVMGGARNPEQFKGIKRENLDPKIRALYDQVASMQAKAGVSNEPSGIERVFDILSRPMFAIANAYRATISEDQKQNGQDVNDWQYIPIIGPKFWNAMSQGQEMWDGFAGYDKTTWADNLDALHPEMNSIAKGVLGFALDIAMDPTSYVGVGAVKSVGKKVLQEGAKIASEGDDVATIIADAFKASDTEKTVAQARETITKAFKEKGVADPNVLDQIDVLDFTNPKEISRFITANVDNPRLAEDMSKIGLEYKARHKRIVSAFIDSTASVIQEWTRASRFEELKAAAMRDGLLVDTTKLHPEPVIRTLKYEALTKPQAEVVAEVEQLLSRRGSVESKISTAKARGDSSFVVDGLRRQQEQINKRLNQLIEETPVDVTNKTIRDTIIDVARNNPHYKVLEAKRIGLRKQMRAHEMYGAAEVNHMYGSGMHHGLPDPLPRKSPATKPFSENYNRGHVPFDQGRPEVSPERFLTSKMANQGRVSGRTQMVAKDYVKKQKELRAVEKEMSDIMSEALLKAVDDVNLPETVRLAKYRKMKDWRTVANQYVQIYNRARKADKAAETAAEAADAAGDVGAVVKAKGAKEKFGAKTSKQTNKALENARREIQYRIYRGELTPQDLQKFMKEAGVDAPDLFHDLATLTPEQSRILHFGELYKPSITKRLTAEAGDVESVVTKNNRVLIQLNKDAQQHAEEITQKVLATALDLMERSTSLEARRAFELRIGFMGNGPAVGSLAIPELVSKLVDQAYKVNIVKVGIDGFNKALVSSAGLDKGIARIRAREAGKANELIARNGERIRQTFQHYHPDERMQAWGQLLRTDVNTYVNPQLVDELRYELDLIAQKFGPDAFPNLRTPLSLKEVNDWIPGRHKMRGGKKVNAYKISGSELTEGEDKVSWLLNSVRESNLAEMDPVQLIWDLQIATEKALARRATIETLVQNFAIPTGAVVKGQVQTDRMAQHLIDKYGYREHRLGTDGFIFDPETAKNLDKIQELFSSPAMMETFGEYAGKITQAWKRLVTVYNPGFHSRNTFGDIFVSWLDGVEGIHGVQSHRMALRTVKKFRNLTDAQDPLIKSLGQPDMMGAYEKAKAAGVPESHKAVLFKKNGQDYTIGDIWAAYVNEGLLSGYTNTEFAAVFKTPKSFGATPTGQAMSRMNQNVLHLSEAREDVFRLAHFIDVVRKSPITDLQKAAAEAGARVRKYHFDYSDFTMTEKLLFARVFPFYKWTRKAMPLMVESLFSKPGKMTLYPKAVNNAAVASGFDRQNPDIVVPEWMQARMLAPILSHDGATTYAGIALPYDALRSGLAPGDTVLGMLHPGLKGILEASMGQKVTGQDFSASQYLTSLFPQSNFATKQLTGSGTPEQVASFLTGITFSQNNNKTIQGELIRRKDAAYGAGG